MSPDQKMRLSLNLRGIGFHAGAWRHPQSTPERVYDIGYYTDIARIAERGKFDAVFLADSPNARTGSQPAISWPLDPFAVLSGIATATERIGLIGTLSTSYSDPYDLARRVGALDLLSGGRAGVNLVTSAGDAIARNFGFAQHYEHADRYRRAEELCDVILALWAAAPHGVSIKGERFSVEGALNLPPSPQGRPVIVQAGASEDGRNFAGRAAEMVFAASSDIATGQALYRDLKQRTVQAGRRPQDIAIMPGVMPFIGSTEAEARRFYNELEELIDDNGASLGRLGAELGLDLSIYDPEGPIPVEDFPAPADHKGGVTRLLRLKTWAVESGLNLRRFAQLVYRSLGVIHWEPVGTPEQIADELELWFRAGTADGFNLLVPQQTVQLSLFVDEVVPILQRRGLFRHDYETETFAGHLGLSRAKEEPLRRTG